jgi:hypothetical protein
MLLCSNFIDNTIRKQWEFVLRCSKTPSPARPLRPARIKKPTSGRPEIGAQFVSFNFPNNLSWAGASRPASRSEDPMSESFAHYGRNVVKRDFFS